MLSLILVHVQVTPRSVVQQAVLSESTIIFLVFFNNLVVKTGEEKSDHESSRRKLKRPKKKILKKKLFKYLDFQPNKFLIHTN